MAYTATVYTHLDEGVRWVNGAITGVTYRFENSTSAGQTTDSLNESITFTAVIASGYRFSRWVYRLGSTTGTVQYSYNNPFTYSGTQNIYIRAETEEDSGSGGTNDEWVNEDGPVMETIDTAQSRSIYLDPYTLYSITIRTKYSGTLTAYSESSLDTIGYLTTGLLWDGSTGKPYNVKAENDDDGTGNNFKLSYSVTAGTTYHLWIRCYNPANSGSVTVYVEPPAKPQTGESGKMYLYISGQGWVPVTPYIYISGQGWDQCTPNLFINGAWEKGK